MQQGLRAEVDAALREIVVDDSYGMNVEVITATGTTEARVNAGDVIAEAVPPASRPDRACTRCNTVSRL